MRERRVPQPLTSDCGEFKRKMRFSVIWSHIKRKFTRLGRPVRLNMEKMFLLQLYGRLATKIDALQHYAPCVSFS
jgi:hypothetical protein